MKGVLQAGSLTVVFHLSLQRGVAHRLVADELDFPDPHLRPFVHVEGEVHQLRSAWHLDDFVLHVRILKPLVTEHVADNALDLPNESRIDERVEADLRVGFFQLLVDLGDLDFLGADVVDDLDALPLLHVVGDDFSDRAVGEFVIRVFDPEVVEELGVPETIEVGVNHVQALAGPRHPLVSRGRAEFQLDVIQVGLWFDHRGVALRVEARRDIQHDGAGPGRRLSQRRRLLATDRRRRQRRGLGLARTGRRSLA